MSSSAARDKMTVKRKAEKQLREVELYAVKSLANVNIKLTSKEYLELEIQNAKEGIC